MEPNQYFEVDLGFISSQEHMCKTSDYDYQVEYVDDGEDDPVEQIATAVAPVGKHADI